MIDPKALFIGPYGENSSEFRDMMQLILEDIIQWRRNFHPQAERLILRDYKDEKVWKSTTNKIYTELDSLLGDMKGSIPFHNPHFIGHMHSDLAMPALLGYAIGQLYNQNNVVGESSPVTTEKEIAFISYLCQMVGYSKHEHDEYLISKHIIDKIPHSKEIISQAHSSTGHLCSGGTTANIEALWMARNLKYFPVTLKLFIREMTKDRSWSGLIEEVNKIIVEYKGEKRNLDSLSYNELFNLPTNEILNTFHSLNVSAKNFFTALEASAPDRKIMERRYENYLKRFSVRSLGISEIHKQTKLQLPVILVPQSRHYSWEKAIDIIGLGTAQIKYIKVDKDFKIDTEDFKNIYKKEEHILMTVAVVGSTEEGAIDPIAKLVDELKIQNTQNGKGCYFHIDAAYGGYFASLFRGTFLKKDFLPKLNVSIPTLLDAIKDDVLAMAQSDSITIDPHKLGYIPYSAGVILYKDARIKHFIEKKAPYLPSVESIGSNVDTSQVVLGASALEGSRSGAAALACYLTSKVITNDTNGYGKLMLQTFTNAQVLSDMFKALNVTNEGKEDFKISVKLLYEPITNIVCFVASVKDYISTPAHLNLLTKRLYERMRIRNYNNIQDFKFFISQTELKYFDEQTGMGYQSQIENLLKDLAIDYVPGELLANGFELEVLRSVQMNPMLESQREKIFTEFIRYLESSIKEILPEVLLEILLERNKDNRLKVLWIENQDRINRLRVFIQHGDPLATLDLSRYLDIEFMAWQSTDGGISTWLQMNNSPKDGYDIYVVDLNLADTSHKEWFSGIKVVGDIKRIGALSKKKPLILIYSQFLNKNLVIDGKTFENIPEMLGEYFSLYAGIDPDCLIAKTINIGEDLPEQNDLEKIVLKLAKHSLKYLQQK